MDKIKFGFLGAGEIAHFMGNTIIEMDEVDNYAVAARDLQRAEQFAQKYGIKQAYGSYQEMLENPEVELIYINTPISHHYEHIKLCLEHGKHVLCEKAFTCNAAQAQEVIELARKNGLLLAEAIWTRYMPSRKMIEEIIDSGAIGTAYSLIANLGYKVDHVERLQKPELAGGALLDIGVYPLNFAAMVFGSNIKSMEASAQLTDTGVDACDYMTLTYEDGRVAQLHSSMCGATDRRGMIYGDQGMIEVTNINNCERITVSDRGRKVVEVHEIPEQITGFEYQVCSCVKAIREGQVECPEMPHQETIQMMEWMDEIRKQCGVKYPNE